MSSRRGWVRRFGALALSFAMAWSATPAADAPPPSPGPEPPEHTRGAWIDVYRAWIEGSDGRAVPVDPGPAFCVGADGFAVADQNAVAGSVHLFATIRGRGPFAARTRAFDPRSGLAAIQLHPKALEGARCLELAGEGAAPLAEGDTVFALGPAGAEPKPLRVRTVTPDSLSFLGGLQETFLAGTPLVDANGVLRGVLVAGTSGARIGKEHATGALAALADRRRANGAVPLAAAATLVEQVRKQRDDGMPVPPPDPVVKLSDQVFPRPLRGAAGVGTADLALYSATSNDVRVEFLTPPSLEAQQASGNIVFAPGSTFFRWQQHVEMWEPMVVVQQGPQFKWTAGSKAFAVFVGIFAIPIALGGGVPAFHASYTFPRSLAAITVDRGGERFEPLDSFVDCFEDSIYIEKTPGKLDPRSVKGCRTFYLFPPRAFAPGAGVIVDVALDAEGKTAAVPVRSETLARIAADFAPWRDAVQGSMDALSRSSSDSGPATTPDAVVAPTPARGIPYATVTGGRAELRVIAPKSPAFVVTRLQRDGETMIRIPVTYMAIGMSSETMFPPGFLYVGRDSISFDPALGAKARKKAFRVARAGVTAEATGAPGLRLHAGGKTWSFRPLFSVTPQTGTPFPSSGEMKEAWVAAVELAARLFGDFDQALRAFDQPELLGGMPVPRAAETPPGAAEANPP